MSSPHKTIIFFIFSISLHCSAVVDGEEQQKNVNIPALFVFGDSTVDPGNNNYIGTIFKSDFPPYGEDFPQHIPTGRFTNGKLVTDFIASYLGIKEYVPPYLNKSLSIQELMTGVSFASAGSGYDPHTAQIGNSIPIQQQLEYFREYKSTMEKAIGTERLETLIRKSGFVVSAGTNDFVFTYLTLPDRHKQYTEVTDYESYLLRNTHNFIQGLVDLGARKIGVVGVPPMGCLPIVVTLKSNNAIVDRGCINSYTEVAKEYNAALQGELQSLMKINSATLGVQIFYAGIYDPLLDMIHNHNSYGFEEWRRGCCGTGLLELAFLCNPKSILCPDPSKFIFWDSIHPTERTYYLLFLAVRDIVDVLAMS